MSPRHRTKQRQGHLRSVLDRQLAMFHAGSPLLGGEVLPGFGQETNSDLEPVVGRRIDRHPSGLPLDGPSVLWRFLPSPVEAFRGAFAVKAEFVDTAPQEGQLISGVPLEGVKDLSVQSNIKIKRRDMRPKLGRRFGQNGKGTIEPWRQQAPEVDMTVKDLGGQVLRYYQQITIALGRCLPASLRAEEYDRHQLLAEGELECFDGSLSS